MCVLLVGFRHGFIQVYEMRPESVEASREAHSSLSGADGGTEASAEQHVEIGVEDKAGPPVADLIQAGGEERVT